MSKTHLTGSVVLMATFALLLGCGKKPDDSTQQPAPQLNVGPGGVPGPNPKRPPLGEPQHKTTVTKLMDEYDKDWKAANAKYAGTVVEVSGLTTGHAFLGKTEWLQPDSPDYGWRWTLAFLDVERNTIKAVGAYGRDLSVIGKVFSGQQVKLKGRMGTGQDNKSPQLQETEVLDFGSDPSVKMSAVELATAAEKDRQALDKKCEKRSLVLSGAVAVDVVKVDQGEPIELKGDGKTRVFCHLGMSAYFYGKGFTAGEQIILVGELEPPTSATPGRITLSDCVPVNRLPK